MVATKESEAYNTVHVPEAELVVMKEKSTPTTSQPRRTSMAPAQLLKAQSNDSDDDDNDKAEMKGKTSSSKHPIVSPSSRKQVGLYCCLYILLAFLTLFSSFISFMYGIDQLLSEISFSNFWYKKTYSLDEIRLINFNNNNSQGNEYTCSNTNAFLAYDKLFSSNPNNAYTSKFNGFNVSSSRHITYSILYFIVSLAFVFGVLIWDMEENHKILLFCSCFQSNKDKTVKNKDKSAKTGLFWKIYKGGKNLIKLSRKRYTSIAKPFIGVDTPLWIAIKMDGEILKIISQTLTLFKYGGISPFTTRNESDDDVLISQLPICVKAYAVIILINDIIAGILWILYGTFPATVYAVFWIDSIFDIIYALYPLVLTSNDNDMFLFDIDIVEIFSKDALLQFLSSFIPLMLSVLKQQTTLSVVAVTMVDDTLDNEYNYNTEVVVVAVVVLLTVVSV